MIREIPEKEWRLTDPYKLNFEFDDQWVVYWSPDEDYNTGYVVAHGNGSHADRDALLRQYVSGKYSGQAALLYGHKPSEVIECIIQQG